MAEIDKILCCDKGNDNNPWAMAAAMNGGMNNGMWNNPFVYLVWMMFAQRMWGNDWGNGQNAQNVELQNQIQSLRSQIADNQNSNMIMDAVKGNATAIGQLASNLNCDFNALQNAICCVKSAIEQVGGQVGFSAERVINAVNMGDCNVIQALKDCCCTTQKSILEMGYQNQLQNCQQTNNIMTGINGVNTGVERGFANLGNIVNQGFSQVGFQAQQDKCDIVNAINAAQQRTSDLLTTHWQSETERKLQDAKFEISQLKQNQYLAGLINGGSCGCGC